MKILLIPLLFLLSFNVNAYDCTELSVEEEWKSADKIFYGRVLEGKYKEERGTEFTLFKVKSLHGYKGRINSVEEVVGEYGYINLRVGDHAIIFMQQSKMIESCGNSQPLAKYLLSEESLDRADLSPKFRSLLVKLLNTGGVSPNKKF